AIVMMEGLQKEPKIFAPLARPHQKQPMARADIECAEDHSPRIAARERHLRRLPPFGPTRSQGGEQQQVSFVFAEDNAAWPQASESLAKSALFSLERGRVVTHSGAASTRTPSAVIGGAQWRRTRAGHFARLSARLIRARSTCWPDSPIARASLPGPALEASVAGASIHWDARSLCDRPRRPGRGGPYSVVASGRNCAGLRPNCGQCGQWVCLGRLRPRRGCADRAARCAPSVIDRVTAVAAGPSSAVCSWWTSTASLALRQYPSGGGSRSVFSEGHR